MNKMNLCLLIVIFFAASSREEEVNQTIRLPISSGCFDANGDGVQDFSITIPVDPCGAGCPKCQTCEVCKECQKCDPNVAPKPKVDLECPACKTCITPAEDTLALECSLIGAGFYCPKLKMCLILKKTLSFADAAFLCNAVNDLSTKNGLSFSFSLPTEKDFASPEALQCFTDFISIPAMKQFNGFWRKKDALLDAALCQAFLANVSEDNKVSLVFGNNGNPFTCILQSALRTFCIGTLKSG